jgi:uncharacterized protein YecE (DUF72 family)
MPTPSAARIGTAGWTIPRPVADRFPHAGSGLQRYAARFSAAEINTTFYRPHRPDTLPRWAASTPGAFRFAIKTPRAITHEARLVGAEAAMLDFLIEAARLGDKLGPVLVQLPPSLAYDPVTARRFFEALRAEFGGPVVFEPRHPTWFDAEPDSLLAACRIARVTADPARHPDAGRPGGWRGLAYWRLHGSPRMYYSAYADETLAALAVAVAADPAEEAWVIFDNTTSGAAAADALRLQERLERA